MLKFLKRSKEQKPATTKAAGFNATYTVSRSMSDEEFAGYVAERARRMNLVSQTDAGPSTP